MRTGKCFQIEFNNTFYLEELLIAINEETHESKPAVLIKGRSGYILI